MWPFLPKPTVHGGVVFYRGPLAPRVEQILALVDHPAAAGAVKAATADGPHDGIGASAVRLTHPAWGEAVVGIPRDQWIPPAEMIQWGTPGLTEGERALAGHAETALLVRLTTPERKIVRARKHLLRWMRLLMTLDGLVALDTTSQLFWSEPMLDDELAHDADLDVEALFTVHSIYDPDTPERTVYWMHTHGLEELGACDFDVLRPSNDLAMNAGDPMRAMAFAALEGHVGPGTLGFPLGAPRGSVDLVDAREFDKLAAKEDAQLRTPDPAHSGRRVVVCEPRGLLSFLRKRPVPSRFLSDLGSGGAMFNFTNAASELMAGRARATLDVFRSLAAEFGPTGLPAVAKIGYPTASNPAGREHLWFEVHGFDGDRIDGTLSNQPFDVPSLTQGARGWHPAADVSDWMLLSPAGPMTPRNLTPARRLRDSGWPDDGEYAGMRQAS